MGLSEIPPANLSGVRSLHSVDFSEWARGKSQHPAVRAMADKWIRILYRYWKDGVAYDERYYQKAFSSASEAGPYSTVRTSGRCRGRKERAVGVKNPVARAVKVDFPLPEEP